MGVGHNHKHPVFRVGHQVAENTRRLRHSAVETFGAVLLIDYLTWYQAGFTPVVQLGDGRMLRDFRKYQKPAVQYIFLFKLCSLVSLCTP